MTETYNSGYVFASLIRIVGWLFFSAGLLGLIFTLSSSDLQAIEELGLLLLFAYSIGLGIFGVSVGLFLKAQFDTAQNSFRLIAILEGKTSSILPPKAQSSKRPVLVHKGYRVPWQENAYVVNGIKFTTAEFAIECIDRCLANKEEITIGVRPKRDMDDEKGPYFKGNWSDFSEDDFLQKDPEGDNSKQAKPGTPEDS